MENKEETPENISPKKVTKEKNLGRVASGKRLAERNRLKKLEAKNTERKEKIISQEEPKEEPKQENIIIEKPVEYKTSNISYLVLAVIVGGGIYIYRKMKTNKKATKVKTEPAKPDPFFME